MFPLRSYALLAALVCFCAPLAGCGTRAITVVEQEQFHAMTRRMPNELLARKLLSSDGSYRPAFALAGSNYGETLYRRLSPSFMLGDGAEVYLGENFASTISQRSRVNHQPNGFSIDHPTQKITVTMVAKADWNGDGEDEWIVSCFVEPKRGGRTRDYYVLVPAPRNNAEPLKGTVAAVYECFGLSCSLFVRDSKVIERIGADPSAPPTEVQDVVPGLQTVTQPPSGKKEHTSGLEERSL